MLQISAFSQILRKRQTVAAKATTSTATGPCKGPAWSCDSLPLASLTRPARSAPEKPLVRLAQAIQSWDPEVAPSGSIG